MQSTRIQGVYISKNMAEYRDGINRLGEKISSGIYFYTIKTGDFIATREIVMKK